MKIVESTDRSISWSISLPFEGIKTFSIGEIYYVFSQESEYVFNGGIYRILAEFPLRTATYQRAPLGAPVLLVKLPKHPTDFAVVLYEESLYAVFGSSLWNDERSLASLRREILRREKLSKQLEVEENQLRNLS